MKQEQHAYDFFMRKASTWRHIEIRRRYYTYRYKVLRVNVKAMPVILAKWSWFADHQLDPNDGQSRGMCTAEYLLRSLVDGNRDQDCWGGAKSNLWRMWIRIFFMLSRRRSLRIVWGMFLREGLLMRIWRRCRDCCRNSMIGSTICWSVGRSS